MGADAACLFGAQSGVGLGRFRIRMAEAVGLAEQYPLILASLVKHYSEQIANFVQFQFFAGLRTSEAIALEWPNVDFNSGEVLVHEVIVYEQAQDSTKTSTSRKVRLNSEAMAALERQKKFTFLASGKVFHDPLYNEP
ncbi:tyrosine-type recombinase/integrase [Pseudoduganella aquatica]|nr:tyrosine-type recombinase/integrase [Pseudoduganella aquatica]